MAETLTKLKIGCNKTFHNFQQSRTNLFSLVRMGPIEVNVPDY